MTYSRFNDPDLKSKPLAACTYWFDGLEIIPGVIVEGCAEIEPIRGMDDFEVVSIQTGLWFKRRFMNTALHIEPRSDMHNVISAALINQSHDAILEACTEAAEG